MQLQCLIVLLCLYAISCYGQVSTETAATLPAGWPATVPYPLPSPNGNGFIYYFPADAPAPPEWPPNYVWPPASVLQSSTTTETTDVTLTAIGLTASTLIAAATTVTLLASISSTLMCINSDLETLPTCAKECIAAQNVSIPLTAEEAIILKAAFDWNLYTTCITDGCASSTDLSAANNTRLLVNACIASPSNATTATAMPKTSNTISIKTAVTAQVSTTSKPAASGFLAVSVISFATFAFIFFLV
ncbi:hypothetical protein HK100_007843 [Physocladia obscura]|uniref:Uncharacterized protein n=1 Tax=Physocladia obscura TaxID=109957 RepID=A0AAD5T770_9FUNG|nr:hypothetical protein HK100_007843 [Physocladia obscura]